MTPLQLSVGDIGSLYKMRVCNALGSPWSISRLQLQDVHTKQQLVFDYSRFLGETDGDIRKELPVMLPNKPILPGGIMGVGIRAVIVIV